jgi:hypothetical protein
MKITLRHFILAFLPLGLGAAAGYGFAYMQQSCGHLVGPILASKCHGVQLRYQIKFQTAGTALGSLLTFVIGLWAELRRRRAVQQATPTGGPS